MVASIVYNAAEDLAEHVNERVAAVPGGGAPDDRPASYMRAPQGWRVRRSVVWPRRRP
jgi:hypothetical protein